MTTPELPEFAYNVQTRRRPHRLPDRPPRRGIRQTTNGYGRHFITLTIPVARVVIEDDSTGPVNHARPTVTIRP